jgi:hypothetical protein
VFKSNGKKAVSLDLEGTILNLSTRKPVAPIPELLQIFNLIPCTSDFSILPELRWLD